MLKNIDQYIKTIKKIKFKAERNVKMLKKCRLRLIKLFEQRLKW